MKFVKTFSGPKNLINIIGSDPTILIGGLSLAQSASESACIEVEIDLQSNGETISLKGYVPPYAAIKFKSDPVIGIESPKPFAAESALFEAAIIFLCAHAQEDFTFYKSPLPAAYFPLMRSFG